MVTWYGNRTNIVLCIIIFIPDLFLFRYMEVDVYHNCFNDHNMCSIVVVVEMWASEPYLYLSQKFIAQCLIDASVVC